MHPEKTRLIEFGRFAADNRARRGLGKPETFNFPGFTFICGKSRKGKFLVTRRTRRDRMRVKLGEIKEELRRRMHQPIPEQGRWLRQVVTGFFNYHAVPTNSAALGAFHHYVTDLWRRSLQRRSQKNHDDMGADEEVGRRLASKTPHPSSLAERSLRRQAPEVRAGCPNGARPDLCGGTPAMVFPTAIGLCGDIVSRELFLTSRVRKTG